LKPLSVQEQYKESFIYQFINTISSNNKGREEQERALKLKLTEVKKKMENIDEKHFALNEMPEESYHIMAEKFRDEKGQIEAELEKVALDTSNLEKQLQTVLIYLSNPLTVWENIQGNAKEKLQKLVFPKGMTFNKEKEVVLTSETNSFFRCLEEFSRGLGTEGGSDSPFFLNESLSAESEGFEPPDLLQSIVFKTTAIDHSASSPLQK
jgi:site-specific DNA recombinase